MALLRSQYGHTAPPSFFFRAAQVVWERHFPRVMMKRDRQNGRSNLKKKKREKIVAPDFFFHQDEPFQFVLLPRWQNLLPRVCVKQKKNVEQRAVVFQLG